MSIDASRSPTILRASNLGRRDPKSAKWLIEDLSLSIAPGECLAVSGPTGAGKTVLLRALAMLDLLETGTIAFQEVAVPPHRAPWFRSHVMYLHQRPVLFPGLVQDNLEVPFRMSAHSSKQLDSQRLLVLLGQLKLSPDFLEKRHCDLSGGERQIACLLRAISLDPAILLLDEPTASLDPASTALVEKLLESWRIDSGQARAVIWVAHDPAQVSRVSTRRMQISSGKQEA